MSLNVPDFLPILSAGSHSSPRAGACIMEYASFLNGEEWTDTPSCTNTVLAQVAQLVNDLMSDEERQRLLPLLPRLMGTGINSAEVDLAIAEGAVDYIGHLQGHEDSWVDLNAVAAVKALAALKAGADRKPRLIAWDAHGAADAAGMDTVDFLSALINAYDKAVGRTSTPVVTADDLRRCAELTGARA